MTFLSSMDWILLPAGFEDCGTGGLVCSFSFWSFMISCGPFFFCVFFLALLGCLSVYLSCTAEMLDERYHSERKKKNCIRILGPDRCQWAYLVGIVCFASRHGCILEPILANK